MDEQETDQIELSGRRGHRRTRPMVVGGVALFAVVAGTGVAFAATNHPAPAATTTSSLSASATPSASASAPTGKHHGRHSRGHGFGGGFGLGGVVHGQVTIREKNGTYETVDVQQGTVTAVSSSSLTIKSADGYTATYAVSSSITVDTKTAGIGSVKSGDSVMVEAQVSGSKVTATRVQDTTAIKDGRIHFSKSS
jgi:hypothetical protein